jgi:hypothetical protein
LTAVDFTLERDMAKALYVAYLTGTAGQSIGLFYIGDGLIAGVDAGGMLYDGTYLTAADGSLDGAVNYVLPAGLASITGAPAGATPIPVSVRLNLPPDFHSGRTIAIETPTGPVNARFEKMKELS